jgi:regulator of replication initiation timing
MSYDFVSRKKYDTLREKTTAWRESSLEHQKRYEDLLVENERLTIENEDLQENKFSASDIAKYAELDDEINCLRTEIERHNEIEATLQLDNSRLEAEVEKHKQRHKEAHKKLRDWEKKHEMKSMMDDLLAQRLPKDTCH